MSGVTFRHPNKDVGNLHLRLPPTQVEWTIKLNTSVQDTFGGQVVQVLSTSYDNLVLQGRFGIEGPHGANIDSKGHWDERDPAGFFDLGSRNEPRRGGKGKKAYEIGLTQMTMYFRRYFTVATAGGDHLSPGGSFVRGAYNQQYMGLSYKGNIDDYERKWLVYPTSFPSYRRSNLDFAPEWQVEFQVVEPDFFIDTKNKLEAIKRLRENVKYRPLNPFSDPLAQFYTSKSGQHQLLKLTQDQLDQLNTNVFDYYGSQISNLSLADLETLIATEASFGNIYERELEKLLGIQQEKKRRRRRRRHGKEDRQGPS